MCIHDEELDDSQNEDLDHELEDKKITEILWLTFVGGTKPVIDKNWNEKNVEMFQVDDGRQSGIVTVDVVGFGRFGVGDEWRIVDKIRQSSFIWK